MIKREKRKSKVKKIDADKITKLDIDGVNYYVPKEPINKLPPQDKIFSKKLQENIAKQDEELIALSLLYKENFKIIDNINRKYCIEFNVRGAPATTFLQLTFSPEYPSDVPPFYKIEATWINSERKHALYQELSAIYCENFGRCFMYLWAEKVEEFIKQECRNNKEFDSNEYDIPLTVEPIIENPIVSNCPEIFEGVAIFDRGSSFTPFLSKVSTEDEVRLVLQKVNDIRKVFRAWRNTYAYRLVSPNGKHTDVGEDGGEPKAGNNLLQFLINCNASNVIVFISRHFGGTFLGKIRYKHLNDVADSILDAHGFKNSEPQNQKKQKKKFLKQ